MPAYLYFKLKIALEDTVDEIIVNTMDAMISIVRNREMIEEAAAAAAPPPPPTPPSPPPPL